MARGRPWLRNAVGDVPKWGGRRGGGDMQVDPLKASVLSAGSNY